MMLDGLIEGTQKNPRIVHAGPRPGLIGNERAGVIAPRRDQRPAVVVTRVKNVHFIAAHGTDFRLPELAGFRIHRQAVAVAVAISEDLGLGSRASDERIVGRHGAVVAKPQRLSHVIVQTLGLHAQTVVFRAGAADTIAIADGDIQRAIGREEDSAGQIAAGLPGIGDENLLDYRSIFPPLRRPRATASVIRVAILLGI